MKKITYGLSGSKLKSRRAILGLTQAEVAERSGMLVANYARFEQADRSNPTLDIAVRIARALLCHVDDLIE